MSLKELKRLAPWQWESKIATKKHKIGPKGLEEWEQIQRAIVGAEADADGAASGGARDKSCVSKRLRNNKDGPHAAAAPINLDVLMELTTPGHATVSRRRAAALHTHSTPAAPPAAAAEDEEPAAGPSAHKVLLQTPAHNLCAAVSGNPATALGPGQHIQEPGTLEPCAAPDTAAKQTSVSARTPATVVGLDLQTPALAILSKAFSPSPYAPTPVPYSSGVLNAPGSSSTGTAAVAAAAAASAPTELRRTRARSTSADTPAAAAAGPAAVGSNASHGAAATGAYSRYSGGRSARSAACASGTPVPKFSLTSPAGMLPPASRSLNAASGGLAAPQQHPKASATPAHARGAVSAGQTTLQRCNSLQSGGSAAQTPGARDNLPNLLDLLVAASAGNCSPAVATAAGANGTCGGYDDAVHWDGLEDQVEMAEAAAEEAAAVVLEEMQHSAHSNDDNMLDTGAGASADTAAATVQGVEGGVTPKDVTSVTLGQQNLPAAALATPGRQVVKALSGAAAATAAKPSVKQQQLQAPGSGAVAGGPPTSVDGSSKAHSGDSAGSVGGSGGLMSCGGSGPGRRAISSMRLKKLWRESHAAELAAAAAAAAAAATADAGNISSAAASEVPAGPQPDVAVRLKLPVLDLSSPVPAARNSKEVPMPGAVRECSPNTLAVACSADLLLLAAAAEDGDAALADADLAAAAASVAAEQAHVARAAAAVAWAPTDELKTVMPSKARRRSSGSGQQQQQQTKVAAARAVVMAAMPRQQHSVPTAPQRRHHLDAAAPAAAAAAGSGGEAAAAATAAGPQMLPPLSNCGNSLMLPHAAQMRLMQLQQHQQGPPAASAAAGAVNASRLHPMPAAPTRVPHVQHPSVQLPAPRTSHTGVSLSLHGLGARAGPLSPVATAPVLTPRGLAAEAGTAAGVSTAQASAGRIAAAAAQAASEAAAAAAKAAAGAGGAAAALSSLCGGTSAGNQGVSAGLAGVSGEGAQAPVLEIAPLTVPGLLSDADSWRLAQSQPWLVEAVAAEARQFLITHALNAVAAAAAVGAAASAAAAGGVGLVGAGGMVPAVAAVGQAAGVGQRTSGVVGRTGATQGAKAPTGTSSGAKARWAGGSENAAAPSSSSASRWVGVCCSPATADTGAG